VTAISTTIIGGMTETGELRTISGLTVIATACLNCNAGWNVSATTAATDQIEAH
jgi:hypothetical protein